MASIRNSFLAYFQKKNLQIILLGCLSGIPLGLLIDPLNYWLAEAGIEKSSIGLFSLILIVYTIKAFWAPLIDRIQIPLLTKKLGHRKGWIILMQICLFWYDNCFWPQSKISCIFCKCQNLTIATYRW